MQVLSQHLYSTPMVAIRELVQNAHDAIIRRRLEEPQWRQPASIHVRCDPAIPAITITDVGSGLTEEEIHQYLATVGVGYTRGLRQSDDDTGLIGMFGLGFASAFVVAEKVTLTTTSWQQPDVSWRYRSTNGESYSIEPATGHPVGTTIELTLKSEFVGLANAGHLSAVLSRYCALLHEPVFVGDEEVAINHITPPWREQNGDGVSLHPALVQKRHLEFAARFEQRFTPLCVLPVEPAGDSDAVGILWLQDGATYGTSDNRNLSLFLRGMLIDDQARELLPPWAGFVGGVIESNRLTPTASREDLQRDGRYQATQIALNESLINGLASLAKNQPEIWRRVIARHNEALMGAALCDERLFDLLKDDLNVPTSQGEMPVKKLRRDNTLTLMLGEDGGFEAMLFRLLQRPVALGYRYAVVPFLRRWAQSYSTRLIEIGTRSGNQQLFALQDISSQEEAWWKERLLDDEAFIAARFEPESLPLIVVTDREAELKKRLEQDDADKRMSTAALMLARQFSQKIVQTQTQLLYLNFSNPAVRALSQCWKAGKTPDDGAFCLLKSLKVLLAAQAPEYQEGKLQQALENFSQVITRQANNLL
ncbi:ATP-binding protein [Affinibrenneria salicis]